MTRREWGCEHCGRRTTDAPRECWACKGAMCLRCTDEHDDKADDEQTPLADLCPKDD